jgi:hypothetical protein
MFMGVVVGCGSGDREVVFVEVVPEKSRVVAFAVTKRIQRIVERVERVSRFATRLGGPVAFVLFVIPVIYDIVTRAPEVPWAMGFIAVSSIVVVVTGTIYFGKDFVLESIYRLYYSQNPGIARYLLGSIPLTALFVLLLVSVLYIRSLDIAIIAVSMIAAYNGAIAWIARNVLTIKRIWSEEWAAMLLCPEEELEKLTDSYLKQCRRKLKPGRFIRRKIGECHVMYPKQQLSL